MKHFLTIIVIFVIMPIYTHSQELVPIQAIFLGQVNVGTDTIFYTITSLDLLWTSDNCEFIYSQRWPLTDNPELVESTIILKGNSNCSSLGSWPGWTLESMSCVGTFIGYGLYLVTNSYTYDYFYLDTRDCDWGYPSAPGGYTPDFWILFDPNGGFLYSSYASNCSTGWTTIYNDETITVWDIRHGGISPDTECFETWQSYLRIANVSNNPKLVWSPHPSNPLNYEVYRAVTYEPAPPPGKLDYDLLATVSSSTLSYLDYDFVLGGTSNKAYYYIKAKFASPPYPTTVIVNTYVQFYKETPLNDEEGKTEYTFFQNFPNPFNSNTIITYSIPIDSYVELKIFDVLGEEIKTIVKEFKTAGNYNANFNAENLPSGIYYYRIISNAYTETKKLILLR